jgi:hypothetical protein
MQLWVVFLPPQSTVRVELAADHAPVQPVRFRDPSVSAAPMKLPLLINSAAPLMAGLPPAVTGDTRVMEQAVCRMHWGDLAPNVPPHPVKSTGTIT